MANLTTSERAIITDSMLKVQSARNSLELLEDGTIDSIGDVEECLESANQTLSTALGYSSRKLTGKKRRA